MSNKKALITGASGGIGLEFAKILAGQGYDLALAARSGDKLRTICDELETTHDITCRAYPKDLSKDNSGKELAALLENDNFEPDFLINNAGFGLFGEFAETDWETEKNMISLNITTLTYLTKYYLKKMIKRDQGKILNIASTASFQPGPLMSVYYATKAYVLSFTQAIAREAENSKVKITALCPGPTSTGFQEASDLEGSRLLKTASISTAKEVAEYGIRSVEKGKHFAIPGIANGFGVFIQRFFPRRFVTKIVQSIQKKD